MSVTRCFGLPGCGKTTLLSYFAKKGVSDPKYKMVFGNVHLNLPGYTYVPFDCFGVYEMTDCLLLIDEATIECGDRDYKNFPKEKLSRFMTHRHDNMDIILFSQEADGLDKKIRSITDRMFYVKKGLLFGKWLSTVVRVPYKIIWPSEENNGGENAGRILMGYVKPGLLHWIFAKRIYRPAYYELFNSWERTALPPLPSKFQVTPRPVYYRFWFMDYLQKTFILLCSQRKKVKRFEKERRSSAAPRRPFVSFLSKKNNVA